MSDADIARSISELGQRARTAARAVAPASREQKDRALRTAARLLADPETLRTVLAANARDVGRAKEKGTGAAMVDRLALDEKRLAGIATAVNEIADLADPVGQVIAETIRPNGLRVLRRRVPLGVIAMIFEARPNVTVEASALTLKAGNAVILRGGSEASETNAALATVMQAALREAGLPPDAILPVPTTDRAAVLELLKQTETVDLVIPRGGEALIRLVTENARVPVVQHYKGVCHLFLDASADIAMAVELVKNGKLQRPSACNALECLLVHRDAARELLPPIVRALTAAGCELRGDAGARSIAPEMKPATDDDWGNEFLDLVLAVRVVGDLDEAMAHVAKYGSGHTEAICTRDDAHATRWTNEVDAACVVVNASTRFHDGGELGLGAEIGIATSRLHWRGPMGLEALTTMKWQVEGTGQTRR
jgi:glutamate-5-semialdehyde dehydrogenase